MNHAGSGILSALLDGSLSDMETARVRAHLDVCAECAANEKRFSAVYQSLRAPLSQDSQFVSSVLHRIRKHDYESPAVTPPYRLTEWFIPAVACAAAVVLIIMSRPITNSAVTASLASTPAWNEEMLPLSGDVDELFDGDLMGRAAE